HMGPALEQIIKVIECERCQPLQVGLVIRSSEYPRMILSLICGALLLSRFAPRAGTCYSAPKICPSLPLHSVREPLPLFSALSRAGMPRQAHPQVRSAPRDRGRIW